MGLKHLLGVPGPPSDVPAAHLPDERPGARSQGELMEQEELPSCLYRTSPSLQTHLSLQGAEPADPLVDGGSVLITSVMWQPGSEISDHRSITGSLREED